MCVCIDSFFCQFICIHFTIHHFVTHQVAGNAGGRHPPGLRGGCPAALAGPFRGGRMAARKLRWRDAADAAGRRRRRRGGRQGGSDIW